MSGRQSHGHALSTKKPTKAGKKEAKKRSQNAFAIASHQVGDELKSRKSRLGQLEGPLSRSKKRSRNDEEDEDGFDDEEEEADNTREKKQKIKKGRFDQLDNDAGSDSEGNEWVMGGIGSDDSDIDSDEAFGESDEEKFDGYAFSGSTKTANKKKANGAKPLDLNEDEEEESDEGDESDDSLGEDAIDLATMLDQTAESSDEEVVERKPNVDNSDATEDDEDEDSDNEDADSDDESSASSIEEDEDDVQDPEKLAALQSLVANLSAEESTKPSRQRNDGASEYAKSSEYAIIPKNKLTIEDLGLNTVKDPNIKNSLKFVDADSKKKSAVLAVPLARRQQDRLDREAAYEQSKKTLDRWKDTVIHNRRAEHLSFPLIDHDKESALANTRLDTTTTKPHNELEAAIQSIMVESGLAVKHNDDDPEYDELESKKLTLEEVKARRDQLRMARELMFREEAKSKRIKKIKSKSYRRVHRKERERQEEKQAQLDREAGIEPGEDEREALDRQRAEARMGDKHGRSKWAKATKSTGRAGWDEDARAGITEMARKEEELKARIAGLKSAQYDEEEDSESSEDESDVDLAGMRLKDKLDRLSKSTSDSGPGSRLTNMDFMLRAKARKKQENDAMIDEIRKDLDGNSENESNEEKEEEAQDVGRRIFGPSAIANAAMKDQKKKQPSHELEEQFASDDDEDEVDIKLTSTISGKEEASPWHKGKSETVSEPRTSANDTESPWITKKDSGPIADSEHKRRKQLKASDAEELDLSTGDRIMDPKQSKVKKLTKSAKTRGEVTFMDDAVRDSDSSDDEDGSKIPFAIRDQEYLKLAFQGDVVHEAFEAEKKAVMEAEDDKIIDTAIPGWGSWVGEGVSKRERNKNKGKFLTKIEGIKQADRRDAKLKNVILNEKRVKKVSFCPPFLFSLILIEETMIF